MLELIASPINFFLVLSLFMLGAIGSLWYRKNDSIANYWSNFFAIAGSVWGIIFAIALFVVGRDLSFSFHLFPVSFFSLAFNIDLLAGFFIFTISLITLFCSLYGLGYVKHFYKKYNIGSLGFFYNLFIASLLLVVTAADGIFFIIAWEIMSISSFLLVIYEHRNTKTIQAGFLYLVMTFVGTTFITLAFLLLYKYTGSFNFGLLKSHIASVPLFIKNIVFILFVIGFGAKSGIIPLHIWLPEAHPAAPSHVSGVMSGVMIKTGVYMMLRLFLDILQPIPLWWGIVILLIGLISSLLGVLYAIAEHDIKRLLAYHSIENIGIILLGLGSALTFYALGMPALGLLGLIAALFHTLNHAVFKSLLFLSAGSVINQMHTRNMEEYGGLIRYMPQTALFFLVGSKAISALPPLNGFFSEWLTFQGLFQGIAQLHGFTQWVFILAAGSLAFTGGLALACFVKAFGTIFLARPRSQEVFHAKESDLPMHVGMGMLALTSILLGVFSGSVTRVLEKVGRDIGIFHDTLSFVSTSSYRGIHAGTDFSFVSAPLIFMLLTGIILVVIFVVYFLINKNQKIRQSETWNCGTSLNQRMEITATGFARSIIVIFRRVLKPSIQQRIEYHDADSRYLLKSESITMVMSDVYNKYFYQPLSATVVWASSQLKKTQGGNINVYISYIFIALIVALFLVL